MFLLKFNKRLWQFQASCNVVCEYDGQVVKVIIYSRRNGHFPVIVLCTLKKICMGKVTVLHFATIAFNKNLQRLCPFSSAGYPIYRERKMFVYAYGQNKSIFVLHIYRDNRTMHHSSYIIVHTNDLLDQPDDV